ncbi:MAG: hypothetical protein CMJ64_14610 [Planctomycetaceae bacterium]|nr:hypothetical protein [Planctomycetaceae bacterium]
MTMNLLSKDLVSLEYREQMQRDLARASVCRFLVAYISNDGMESIGRHLLNRVLRDHRSFGVGSLTCSCGYEPLLRLQSELPDLRLKYFMDPLVKEDGEPSEISLFHSKLVYLYLEREAKSVVYIGSHNWSRRALGPQGPRNAEASVRFELEFAPEDLDGTGTSVASDVNRHLLEAWNMPLCLPATASNEPTFREWFEKGCRRSAAAPLQENTILLAVRRNSPSGEDWLALAGRGIYLQVLDEDDGQLVWRSNNRVLVLVWNSEPDMAAARQPVMLQCRITTSKAGIDSQLRGTNQSAAPVAGFEAVIWDDAELAAQQNSQRGRRPPVRLWSGREVQVYDFEFPTQFADSSQIDGSVRPKYQFHLEVERVVLPATGDLSKMPDYVWSPESFSVAASRDAARMEETPGYYVEPDREHQILNCLSEVLFVQPEEAKVLPYSTTDRMKVGKRISTHPLHETFLGPEWKEKHLRDEYYERSVPGAMVAELDSQQKLDIEDAGEEEPEELTRLQRVFTSPIDRLLDGWGETAKSLNSQSHGKRGKEQKE